MTFKLNNAYIALSCGILFAVGIAISQEFNDDKRVSRSTSNAHSTDFLNRHCKSNLQATRSRNHSNNDDIDPIERILSQGDSIQIASILKSSDSSKRFEILVGMLKRNDLNRDNPITSFEMHYSLIKEFGGGSTGFLLNSLFENISENINEETLFFCSNMISDNDWPSFSQSVSRMHPEKIFDLGYHDTRISPSRSDSLVAEAGRSWLDIDSVAASARIASMNNSPKRDLVVLELISWLVSRGDGKSALDWVKLIDNNLLVDKALNNIKNANQFDYFLESQ